MTDPSDDYDDDFDQDDCGNCGGEGVTYDCIDGCCENAEDGCDLCARRCDWCRPPNKAEREARAALQKVLSDALSEGGTKGD